MVASLLALALLVCSAPAFGASAAASDSSARCQEEVQEGEEARGRRREEVQEEEAGHAVARHPDPAPSAAPSAAPAAADDLREDRRGGRQRRDHPRAGPDLQGLRRFGDPRLPSQFVGNAPDPLAETPLDDVAAQWAQLSAGAQATLGPFLIPPFHQGSYWDQQVNRSSVTPRAAIARDADPARPWCDPTTNNQVLLQDWSFVEADSGAAAGKVRIWYQNRYPTDVALAGSLMTAMETKIWPSLTATLMLREPLPDGGSTESCSGGSDALDIALVDGIAKATTYASGLAQEGTSAKMIFPRTGSGSSTPILAHEFMHMIQYSFIFSSGTMASGENAWLKEGTAQWVQDYVSASQYGVGLTPEQTEHQALQYFFPYPEKSLDSTTPGYHDYGSYLFWLWAARKGNDPTVVRQVWNAVASQKSINAAKSLFGSGWAQAWKDFTKANWNKDPIGDYQDWDDIHDSPKVAAEGILPNEFTAFNIFVDPVAAKYLTFEPADDVNVLTYRNVGAAQRRGRACRRSSPTRTARRRPRTGPRSPSRRCRLCDIEELTLVCLERLDHRRRQQGVFRSASPPSRTRRGRSAGRRSASLRGHLQRHRPLHRHS